MICPKCKSEYVDGYTECSDCGVDLVPISPIETRPRTRSRTRLREMNIQGISLVRYGLELMFFAIFQLIAAIVAYEFLWVYKVNHGGVSGTAIENIHPLIWCLWLLEMVISFVIIIWGTKIKKPVKGSTNQNGTVGSSTVGPEQ